MQRIQKFLVAAAGAVIWSGAFCAPALAEFDLSLGFNYSRSNYSEESYTWNRRWGLSTGYRFTETSEVEISFTDVLDRNRLEGLEDTTFHDRIYSINYVQSLFSRQSALQPYLKVGVGQLNRDASGTYYGGGAPPAAVDSVTGVFAFGTRLYFTRKFAIRIEGTSYLSGGAISTWRDNFAFTFGTSISL